MNENYASIKLAESNRKLKQQLQHFLGILESSDLSSIPHEQKIQVSQRITEQLQKLHVMELVDSRQLIAITGMQGAGKTKLIKDLFSKDADALPDNLGRGEVIPVIITQTMNAKTRYVLKQYNMQTKELVIEECDNATEFSERLKNPTQVGEKIDICAELHVSGSTDLIPDHFSFVLLPGMEELQHLSQKFIELFLYSAALNICLVRKDTVARDSQLMLNLLAKTSLVKPIYLMSHADVQPHTNQLVADQLREYILKENGYEPNIVIKYSEGATDWKNNLIENLNHHGIYSDSAVSKRMAVLREVSLVVQSVTVELEKHLRGLQATTQLDSESQQKKSLDIIVRFEDQYLKVVKSTKTDVVRTLERVAEAAAEKMQNFIKNEFSFFDQTFKLKRLRRDSYDEKLIMEKKIVEYWNQSLKRDLFSSLIEIIDTKYEHSGLSEYFQKKVEQEQSLVPLQQSIQNVTRFVDPDETMGFDISQLKKDINHFVEFCLLVYQSSICFTGNITSHTKFEGNIHPSDIKRIGFNFDENIDLIKSKFDKVKSVMPELLKMIPVILGGAAGVDVAIDGESDLLKHAISALGGLGISVTGPQLLLAIGGVIGAVMLVSLIRSQLNYCERKKWQYHVTCMNIIKDLPQQIADQFEQSITVFFGEIRDNLEEKILQKSGHYDMVGQTLRLQFVLRDIKKTRDEMASSLRQYENFF